MTASKIVAAAASGVGGAGLDVDEVFRTFLYTGDGSGRGIVNNIDLLGEGGLVWTKERGASGDNNLIDTVRGANKRIRSDQTGAESTRSDSITSFENDGYNLSTDAAWNNSGDTFVSWTFRKAPKFFDVLTYTGTGTPQNISHSLNSTVGMIAVKRTDTTGNWAVYHRGANGGTDPEDYHAGFNLVDEFANNLGYWNDTAPTTTQFTVGDDSNVNANNGTFVAYLFAHNNNDGEFGPDADQDVIKCGSYTGNGSATGPVVNLGFEPQWVMIKRATGAEDWVMFDNMRSLSVTGIDRDLRPNKTQAEGDSVTYMDINATGFQLTDNNSRTNENNDTYIYMAIAHPICASSVPDDATKVFSVNATGSGTNLNKFNIGFVSDFNINTTQGGSARYAISRLTGARRLRTDGTNTQSSDSTAYKFWNDATNTMDLQSGWWGSQSDVITWSWKRAPSYFDVCCYTGTGSARTVSHNLGVVPEMMWVKARSASGEMWFVYHKDLNVNGDNAPETDYLWLNGTHAAADDADAWNDTAPTASVFSVKSGGGTNNSGTTYIAYLFATAPGVSKVGSFSPTGSTLNVDCGFSSGARFVLAKQTDSTEGWYLWDSVRGIVAGNDPYLYLNGTGAETTNADYIDPHSSGFTITSTFFGSGNFIFYAIA